ncbi:MAG: cysteine peptidase family C39 domain-containing protein [Bacteroidota bacterium]|nr:cysteine peptidase family C39 domain-containing protein [Bacteroidota bacterium]
MQLMLLDIITSHLGIKISKSTIQKSNSSASANLTSLSDHLNEWNIKNFAVKIQKEQLIEIPYPSIAHLSKNGGHFVVLQKLENDILHYIDPDVGLIKESLKDFEKKWTGVALLVEATEKSGEDGYQVKRRHELFIQYSKYVVWLLIGAILVIPILLFPLYILPSYLLKIVGGGFCFLLLQKQFGTSSKAVAAFCTMGSKSNCDAVIDSAGAKLFGIVSLSELGTIYFIGGILSIILSAFAIIPINGFVSVLSFALLPFTLVSVYYQWRVVKAWCPLCLAVMLIVWLEVFALYPWTGFSFSTTALIILLISFSLPVVFWLAVRERFIDSFRIPNLERSLSRFTRSDRIFQTVLANQPTVDLENFEHEISIGNSDAPVTITLISNPACGPCAVAHAAVEDLLSRFEDRVKVNFRFTFNANEPGSESTRMVRHLIALSLADQAFCMKALSDWYLLGGKRDLKKWLANYAASTKNGQMAKVDAILKQQANWFKNAQITSTPTLLINGKKYPEEYTMGDLKFQIRKLLESIPEREPAPVS